VRFEKWQALANDYLILEEDQLAFALTPATIRALCAPHTGVGADGIALLARPHSADPPAQSEQADRPAAHLRIFNPDGSEAEVSGNGAREAALYLHRRGLVAHHSFSLQTAAGPLAVRITSDKSCTIELGQARTKSEDYPSGADHGRGELSVGGRQWAFQHVQVGNPQVAIRVQDERQLEALDLETVGPEIERHELFPNRTNVSWFAPLERSTIRARIFERGVGETAASGTGAIGAAVAHVLDGGVSPVTVLLDGGELTVQVDDSLELSLSGWAAPVFAGELASEFVEELRVLS
jgi:diaminopimelate epimerase